MPDLDPRFPFTAFNFAVEIQLPNVEGVSQPLCAASFSECDGLEISFDVKTIREGGNNARQIRLTGPATLGQLSLKRGMTRSFNLWTWVTNVQRNPALRAEATVVMFSSEQGKQSEVKARFVLSRCLPVKIKAPALNAKDGLIAVEELQVAYEALELRPPDSKENQQPDSQTSSDGGTGGRPMAELAKAQLQQLDAKFENEVDKESSRLTVQFNPETLKVSYANQLVQPEGGGDQRGAQAQLFVGAGTTKLTCQLWFDVSAPQPAQENQQGMVDDVRKLTNRVSFFITPKKQDKKFVPPAVRFLWGSFQFDGIMEAVEESLEFFSPEGKPLRASVSITLTQQKIIVFPPAASPGTKSPGSTPTKAIPSGKSVQQETGPNWQSVASRNGIENPRRPRPGQRIS